MNKIRELISREELDELRAVSRWRNLWALAFDWGWILGMMALYIAHPSWWTFALGWLVISGRHLGLAILQHEAAHNLLVPDKKWNDRLGQWLIAYPILNNALIYRMIHLQHHKYTWTDKDPDLGLANKFPITKKSLWRKIRRDLSGKTGYERYRSIIRMSAGLKPGGKGLEGKSLAQCLRAFARAQKGFLITNGILLLGCTLAGRPDAFFLLWWLPALTGYSLVLRIRNIAEHAMVPDTSDELLQTRTTLAPWWVRFFMAPHNVNYHLEHHIYMWIPQYNLPKVFELFDSRGGYENACIERGGYRAVLKLAASKTGEDDTPRERAGVLPFSGG